MKELLRQIEEFLGHHSRCPCSTLVAQARDDRCTCNYEEVRRKVQLALKTPDDRQGGYAIALLNEPETEAELEEMGVEKRVVYLKRVGSQEEGDGLFFGMRRPPLMFATTHSWWGAGEY